MAWASRPCHCCADSLHMRHRTLVIAEACNPEWVSVPLVGWSHYAAIARVADAHLVTQIRNRPALLRAGLTEGEDFTAIDSEAVVGPINKLSTKLRGGTGKGWTTKMALLAVSQPYFDHQVWKSFGGRIRAKEFDVVHQLTPVSPTLPARLAGKCKKAGVPFVWGPLNGGVPWPKGFDSARRREREWLSYVRDAYKLIPGYRSARESAAALLIGSRDTWRQMPAKYHGKCLYLPENAIDPAKFSTSTADRPAAAESDPVRAIFVGRLVAYKGPDLLLEAAAELLKSGRLALDVVGDGPLMPDLRRRVEQGGLKNVTLHGWVEHAKVQEHLARAHLMPFPSIREFGGGVALEAMALGVVPIVPDYGGLGELVTDGTGWLVPMADRPTLVGRFREILTAAVESPGLIDAKSGPAKTRALGQFTWDAKAAQTVKVYDWVAGRRGKPDFPMPTPR